MRVLLRGLLVVVATAFHMACSPDDELACDSSKDCAPYGEVAQCRDGHCVSAGLRCAEEAGLNGTRRVSGDDLTVARALEEWQAVVGTVMTAYCDALATCRNTPDDAACIETAEALVENDTCCESALDFYVAHRDALRGCLEQGQESVPCENLSPSALCPALDDPEVNYCD